MNATSGLINYGEQQDNRQSALLGGALGAVMPFLGARNADSGLYGGSTEARLRAATAGIS